MELTAISTIVNKMNEVKELETLKRIELEETLRELAQLQKKIASLEQDIAQLQTEYQLTDEHLRPNMVEYLKNSVVQINPDEILA